MQGSADSFGADRYHISVTRSNRTMEVAFDRPIVYSFLDMSLCP